jgi:desulfoferrodoxin-like iron-binding protein
MTKAKRGDVLSCEVCGLIVEVNEIGFGMAEIACCKLPMARGQAAASKTKKKVQMQLAAKTSSKASKVAPAKPAVKSVAKPKPAAKKTSVVKSKVAAKKKK